MTANIENKATCGAEQAARNVRNCSFGRCWTEEGGKVPLVVALTSDLVKKGIKAGDIVKQLAAIVGGSGGGKPDYAQAGGKDASKLPDALKKAAELGGELLKRDQH